MSESGQRGTGGTGERRIRYVDAAGPGDVVLMRFQHPAAAYAVWSEAGAGLDDGEALNVTVVPTSPDGRQGLTEWMERMSAGDGAPPVYIKYRGVELLWRPERAVLLCDPDQAEALVAGVVEFAQYERELRRIEEEIAAAWGELEQDNTLAFDVTTTDLKRSEEIGGRMERTLRRRIRFARIEPHLGSVDAGEVNVGVAAAGRKLGEELRERTEVEARAEIVDGQLEVFEHVYEMGSQRMGEYKAARQGHLMEWAIIWLLVAEAVLMTVQTILRIH